MPPGLALPLGLVGPASASPLRSLVLAIVAGLIVFELWVGLEGWYPELPFLGKRTGLDPDTLTPAWKWPFIVVRFFGSGDPGAPDRRAVLAVVPDPLADRSRTSAKVPIGRVTPLAAGVTSVVFAFAHPEWLPALLTGLLWAGLLWQTRSVSACVLSHAVANSPWVSTSS